MKKIISIILGLSFLFLTTLLSAQTMFRAICFKPIDGLESVYIKHGSDLVEIKLPTDSFSSPEKYYGSSPVIFYKQDMKDGRPVETAIAEATLPEGVKNVIFLFIPSSESEAKSGRLYQVIVMPEDDSNFQEGTVRFVNLSPNAFKAKIGDQELVVGSRKISTFKPEKIPLTLSVSLTYKESNDAKEWRPLSSTNWSFTARRRVLLFVYYDEEDESMRTKGISDTIGQRRNQ